MVTRCYLCGGKVIRKRVTAENWWGDVLALIEDVPAMVCEQCGEVYFDSETAKELERLRQSAPKVQRTVKVPVYSYPRAS